MVLGALLALLRTVLLASVTSVVALKSVVESKTRTTKYGDIFCRDGWHAKLVLPPWIEKLHIKLEVNLAPVKRPLRRVLRVLRVLKHTW